MRRFDRHILAGACAAGVALFPAFGQPHAGASRAAASFSTSATSESYRVPVRSMAETKFNTIVRQRYDFSCGSAALATLLRYHYDRSLDEEATFRGMWAEGDREQIRRLGFSLLDMKRYLTSIGLASDGFKVSLDQIAKARVPGIALITLNKYRHFVVVKGLDPWRVLVGDPATGLRTMSRAEFLKNWNGIYFVLNSETERGRAHFNTPFQWAQYPRVAPNAVFLRPADQQTLALTAPFRTEF
jgi:predicted double-glycine peptidase